MKKTAIFLPIFLLVSVVSGQNVQSLTNQDIIEMSRAALPESVIISKIKATPNVFTTDIESLKTLNAEKVPAAVISAMIESGTAPVKPADKQETSQGISVEEVTAAPELTETRKVVSRLFTPYSQLSKTEQKQRLKSSANIEIAAPIDKTSSWIIKAFQSWNYQIDSESPRSIVLSKEVPGIGNKMLVGMAMGGDNHRYKIQVSLAETSGLTNVTVDFFMTSQNAFGKTNSQSVNQNKKLRAELDDLLLKVKNYAEAEDSSEKKD